MAEAVPETLEVAIAGGSIAGLCAGVALHAAGFDVHVFERSSGRLTSRGAGIVVQPELLGLLAAVEAPTLAMTGCTHRRHIDPRTAAVHDTHMPQRFTSWEAIFAALRGAFPDERYHAGAAVELIDWTTEAVNLRVGAAERAAALLIGADGFRSALRTRLAPDTLARYAGYIAWRGVLDEQDAPEALVRFFDDRFSFCNAADGGHALCYLIPGDGLGVARGQRRLNWVWYVTVADGPALDTIMTDRDGVRRDAAVPAGLVNEAALRQLHERADRLDQRFAALVRATRQPFIQAIVDIAPSRMAFGRVCLLGDAAFVVRPHTAAAAAKAAGDAAALARTLRSFAPDLPGGLAAWEHERLAIGRELLSYGVSLGERARRAGGQ